MGKRAGAVVAALAALALGSLALLAEPHAAADTTQVPGVDVSGHQGNVDWAAAWAAGARFAYIKATEGTGYRNPYFAQQYNGSYQVGMIRGAYHFARPDVSNGPTQAAYFVAHGGAWSADGRTLPPMLDIEYNPYGPTCYGLSRPAMIAWIRAFSEEVHARTTRWPMLYTTTDWWTTCTGNSPAFGDTHPLFIARYADSVGALPSGWHYYTMWQYSDSGNKPGDQDTFNGSMDQLIKFATGDGARSTVVAPPPPPATTAAPTPKQPDPTTSTSTTTTTTNPSTPSTTGARTDSTSSTTTSPPSSVAAVAPPTTTTTSPPSAQPISGLVWAGRRSANPPAALHGDGTANELVAQADPAPAASKPATTTSPAVTAQPQSVQADARPLASTGTQVARSVVFGAALLMLGVILTILARGLRPAHRRR